MSSQEDAEDYGWDKGNDDDMMLANGSKDLPLLSTEAVTVTDERNQSSPDETREDAIDLSLKEHTDEVVQDSVTNPVEQANKKRARTQTYQGGFLASDQAAAKTAYASGFKSGDESNSVGKTF